MILRLRYILLRLLLSPAFFLLILTLFSIPLFLSRGGEPLMSGMINHPWRFIYLEDKPLSAGWFIIISLLLIILIPTTIDFVLDYYFRNSTATEILLFRLFLLLIPLHAIRVLTLGVFLGYLPAVFVGFASRVDLFIHLAIILTLFASSLFAVGISFSRLKLILSVFALIALGFAVRYPMDETLLTGSLVQLIVEETPFSIFCLFLELLTLLNYGYVVYTKSKRNYLTMLMAVLISIAGYEMLYHFNFAGIMAGLLLVIGGTFLYAREVYSIYLW
jgi:hypothetical protein